MRIPAAMKLRHGRLKYVTRRLAERYLPRALIHRPKKGFGFPLALWLRGPLRAMMQRSIDDSRLVQEGLFRREELQLHRVRQVIDRLDLRFRREVHLGRLRRRRRAAAPAPNVVPYSAQNDGICAAMLITS